MTNFYVFESMLCRLSVGWIVGLSVVGALLLAAIIVVLCLVPLRLWFRAMTEPMIGITAFPSGKTRSCRQIRS